MSQQWALSRLPGPRASAAEDSLPSWILFFDVSNGGWQFALCDLLQPAYPVPSTLSPQSEAYLKGSPVPGASRLFIRGLCCGRGSCLQVESVWSLGLYFSSWRLGRSACVLVWSLQNGGSQPVGREPLGSL